jgi:hypothetical protein
MIGSLKGQRVGGDYGKHQISNERYEPDEGTFEFGNLTDHLSMDLQLVVPEL